MDTARALPRLAPVLLALTCGPGPATTGTETGSGTGGPTTQGSSVSESATSDSTSTSAGPTSSTETKFDIKPPWGCTRDDECRPGEKCQVCGGGFWANCQPLASNPAQEGEPCTIRGAGDEKTDDCDAGLFCSELAPEPVCVTNCTNGCDDGDDCDFGQCWVECVTECDPVDPVCDDFWACAYTGDPYQPLPFCVPTWEGVGLGEPCDLLRPMDCAPGLACLTGFGPLPACPGDDADGCCTPYCHTDDPDPCPLEGTTCVPLIDNPPPEFETLGLCTPEG